MSQFLFALLASAVMIAALVVVYAAAQGAAYLPRPVHSRLAVAALLGYGLVLTLRPPGWALIDVTVLSAAAGGALLLARWLPNPSAILIFLAVAALANVISTSVGPTAAFVEQYQDGQNDLLLYLTVVLPLQGRIVPIVGVGDLFAGGAVATVLLHQKYRAGPVFGTVALGLILALVYAFWRGGIAAMPWMAATVALLVWWGPIRRSNSGPKDELARDE